MKENKQLVGVGRKVGGRIMFTTVDGAGFITPISKKNEVEVKPMNMTVERKVEKKVDLDIPSFLKKAPRPVRPIEPEVEAPTSNVIIFPTSYKGETKRTFRNDLKKVWTWLWDLECEYVVFEGGEE